MTFQNTNSESNPHGTKGMNASLVLRDMRFYRVEGLTVKSGAMKLMSENIRVLYIARDCVEPYVEVGLLQVFHLGIKNVSISHPFTHPSLQTSSNPVINSLVMLLC